MAKMDEAKTTARPAKAQPSQRQFIRVDGKRDLVRVLIIDDHPAICEALMLALSAEQDIEVCGTAESPSEALAMIQAKAPDVAIVDIRLQEANGLSLVRLLRAEHPEVKTIVFSMCRERRYAELAIRAGAMGFVSKGGPTDRLVQAVRAAAQGELYLRRRTALQLVGKLLHDDEEEAAFHMDRLTGQERAVFELLGNGHSMPAIAEQMNISRRTVAVYCRRVKEKLGMKDVKALIQEAFRWVQSRRRLQL